MNERNHEQRQHFSQDDAHTIPIAKEQKILFVSDIYKLQVLKFYYKLCNGKLPLYLQHIPFILNENIHNYDTRGRGDMHVTHFKTELERKCVGHMLPQIINTCSLKRISKVQTHSLHGFSNYAKTFFFKWT